MKSIEYPCYIISSNGFRDSVSFQYDEGYGKYVGQDDSETTSRDIIKTDIRTGANWNERNGVPVYFVSDHGNLMQVRRVTLRKR